MARISTTRLLNFFQITSSLKDEVALAQGLRLSLWASILGATYLLSMTERLLLLSLSLVSEVLSRFFKVQTLTIPGFLGVLLVSLVTLPHLDDLLQFRVVGFAFGVLALIQNIRLQSSRDFQWHGLFQIALASSLSLGSENSFWASFALIAIVWNLICLLRLHFIHFSWSRLLSSVRLLTLAFLYAIPLLILLVWIFQRNYHHGSGHLRPQATIGLTSRLEPGLISELTNRSDIAYRVQLDRPLPPHFKPYWRVATLSKTQGLIWDQPDYSLTQEHPEAIPPECLIQQSVVTSDTDANDHPIALESVKKIRFGDRLHQVTSSICRPTLHLDLSIADRTIQSHLDFSPSKRVQELVNTWLQGSPNSEEIVNRAIRYLHQPQFQATLKPGSLPPGVSALDAFLFESRRGFCEHFAGSLATLLRIAKVPARIVVGFKGGTFNPYGNYWAIPYSSAHAWVEYWNGHFWQRVDPTPVILSPRISPWLERIFLYWDMIEYRSTQWLSLQWSGLKTGLIFAFAIASLLFGVRWIRSTRRRIRHPKERFMRDFVRICDSLAEIGLKRLPPEGYDTYRLRIRARLLAANSEDAIALAALADRIFTNFLELQYCTSEPSSLLSDDELRRFKSQVQTLNFN